jgi:ERF superfamily
MNATLTPTEVTTLPSPGCGGGEFAFLAMIERAARDPSIDIDKLDRLLLMRERENARVAEQAFNAALAEAQTQMHPVATDSDNPQTRSRYASYAALDRAVRPIYAGHGFALSFNTAEAPGPEQARIVCDVSHVGGHTRRYHIDMPVDGKGARGGDVMTKPHAMGSGVSYGMRYLLRMIFNLAIDYDDDGNAAGGRADRRRAEPARKPDYVVPPPSRRLKEGGIAERAITKRYEQAVQSVGPSQPFPASEAGKAFSPRFRAQAAGYDELNPPPHDSAPDCAREAAKALNRRLHPMNDELPGDLGQSKAIDTSERDGIPGFLDRRKANGSADDAAEPSYLDLVGR